MSSGQIKDRCILNSFIEGGGIVVDRFLEFHSRPVYGRALFMLFLHIMSSFFGREFFNGHGSRHIAITGVEESTEPDFIFFPTSRSIQPTALRIRSCLLYKRISAIASVSSKRPLRIHCQVETIEMRCSQMRLLWAS